GVVYEVDAALVGETVTLRFDPHAPPGRPVQVVHGERPMPPAKPLDAYANCFVKRNRPSHTLETDTPPPEPPQSRLALRDLNRRDDEHDGVDDDNGSDGHDNEERGWCTYVTSPSPASRSMASSRPTSSSRPPRSPRPR